MKEITAAQNLLSAYILINAARQNLEFLYEFRREYTSKDFIHSLKQVKGSADYFCGNIEKTLISKIDKEQFDIIQEQAFQILEQLDEAIKEVK
jgi:hypothetical protein